MERALTFELERRFLRGPLISAAASWPLDGAPVTVLFGASGSGKTTVLRALAGLDRPDRGSIVFDGETWVDTSRGVFVPTQQRGVGFLFQDYALFPHLSVGANVAFGLGRLSSTERANRVADLARRLGIEALLQRRPSELSGGQRQRIALARALAPRPRLLLLDEPLSALDAPSREELRGELRHLLESSGIPAIVVTHDRTEALALGDRLVVLAEGGVRQIGPVHEVFSAPADAEVARIVGTENVLPAKVVRRVEGLVVVRTGEAELIAPDPGDVEEEAFACVRAEDVTLEADEAHDSSAQNRLSGAIVVRRDEGPLVRVTLDCGVRIVALVTRSSAERLGLTPGRRMRAVIKATSIRIVARRS